MSVESTVRAVTTYRLTEMKQRGEKIAMLTSYDYSMAKIVDAAGIDVILVGDSAANVMAGYETTLPITLDMMIYHACSVVRAVNRALVVVDLPFGTYNVRAKEEAEAEKLVRDAHLLSEAGCFGIVLEKIPAALAARVTGEIPTPTIGIGAGGACDGQVLVIHDMLGINKGFSPRFLRRYADLHELMTGAVQQYIKDVKECDFPSEKEQY